MSTLNLDKYSSHFRAAQMYIPKSNHDDFQLVAFVLEGRKIISVGWNKDHLHAEHMALNRAWRSDLRGCSLLVFRFRPNGVLGMAKPCQTCQRRLAQAGIRWAIYSNRIGGLDQIRLEPVDPKIVPQYPFIQPRTSKE